MVSSELTLSQFLKIKLFSAGLRISSSAREELTAGGTRPLTVREYATTGGITLALEGGVYVNAPFDPPFGESSDIELCFDAQRADPFYLAFPDGEVSTWVVPLPGYLAARDSWGNLITDTTFSHLDRVRLSPVYGCIYSCKFCDIPGKEFGLRPLEQLLEGLATAKADSALPVRHALISGGTPGPRDYAYFDGVCEDIVAAAEFAVDVMMPPRPTDPGFYERLDSFGVHGYAINLEAYSPLAEADIAPQKQQLGLGYFTKAIERAVDVTGGNGRVRSLVLVGLEPAERTLEAVEYLAQLGCDPVLSPFRPTAGTPLADHAPPSLELLEYVYLAARETSERYGVKLGPRCVPCQHNTLTFPDGSQAYDNPGDQS